MLLQQRTEPVQQHVVVARELREGQQQRRTPYRARVCTSRYSCTPSRCSCCFGLPLAPKDSPPGWECGSRPASRRAGTLHACSPRRRAAPGWAGSSSARRARRPPAIRRGGCRTTATSTCRPVPATQAVLQAAARDRADPLHGLLDRVAGVEAEDREVPHEHRGACPARRPDQDVSLIAGSSVEVSHGVIVPDSTRVSEATATDPGPPIVAARRGSWPVLIRRSAAGRGGGGRPRAAHGRRAPAALAGRRPGAGRARLRSAAPPCATGGPRPLRRRGRPPRPRVGEAPDAPAGTPARRRGMGQQDIAGSRDHLGRPHGPRRRP